MASIMANVKVFEKDVILFKSIGGIWMLYIHEMWAMPATPIQLPCPQAADTPDISAAKPVTKETVDN